MPDPLLIALFDAAVHAARGEDLLAAHTTVSGDTWRYIGPGGALDVALRGRVFVTGAGKAAASLARGLEAVLGDRIDSGVVLVKHGHAQPLRRIRVLEGDHPVPDAAGLAGTQQLMQTVEAAAAGDTMFFVLTGGASALLIEPAPGLSFADLQAASRLLGRLELDLVAAGILDYTLENCVKDGVLGKGPDDARVDASLVSLATPFSLLDPGHPVVLATVEKIRTDLASPTGGIRRYRGDTYFGGNPWLLLTAWLGWHDRLSGNEHGHASARNWVLDNASTGCADPEVNAVFVCTPHHLHAGMATDHEPQDAAFVGPWLERWGPVANPLLWSHAKFILMESGAKAMTWN